MIRSIKSFVKNTYIFQQFTKLIVVVSKLKECKLSPLKPLIIFDVGANDGSSFLDVALLLKWVKVYAFEPTPYLVKLLEEKSRLQENYKIVPAAVGVLPGRTEFKIAGQSDWGCSSLLDFSEGLETTWPGRTDFKVTEIIDVEVIRLDSFMATNNIHRIDFLHIDTQGTDLMILKSLGEFLERVNSGVVEVPHTPEVMLYKNQHTKEEMLKFLEENNFKVWKTTHQQNEDNLYFERLK